MTIATLVRLRMLFIILQKSESNFSRRYSQLDIRQLFDKYGFVAYSEEKFEYHDDRNRDIKQSTVLYFMERQQACCRCLHDLGYSASASNVTIFQQGTLSDRQFDILCPAVIHHNIIILWVVLIYLTPKSHDAEAKNGTSVFSSFCSISVLPMLEYRAALKSTMDLSSFRSEVAVNLLHCNRKGKKTSLPVSCQ